jgi:hypothetical protein
MNWAQRFPSPTVKLPKPVGEEPPASVDFTAWSKWCRVRAHWNEYVRAFRRHEIALAVDELIGMRANYTTFGPEDSIALHAGMNLLDADGDKSAMSENGET